MSAPKQSRRKGAKKLAPIDWHEFANDAVLNGNMSTLYQRPPAEDSSAYASPEALLEIEKRQGRPAQMAVPVEIARTGDSNPGRPTVGREPTVGTGPTVGLEPIHPAIDDESLNQLIGPTVGLETAAGVVESLHPIAAEILPPSYPENAEVEFFQAIDGPTVGPEPTVGLAFIKRVKLIRDVQDALTLAGQVLYKTMYGTPDGAKSKNCTKGYRQLAAETHLDKDTVRDLIREFKEKGIVRETGTYNADTRSAKTYEVFSYKAILQMWREAGVVFVTIGRQRPSFCTGEGKPFEFIPTVGPGPTVGFTSIESDASPVPGDIRPTVGLMSFETPSPDAEPPDEISPVIELIEALQQITAGPVDQEAAEHLIRNCRSAAVDCTIEEIIEFAWSKAFLCRSGKIENPVGFLITQVPKHFQSEVLQAYREKKRKELESAAEVAARENERLQQSERELAEQNERQHLRVHIAERHRKEQGIDLKSLLRDSEADSVLKDWAKRMLNLGHKHQPGYD